MIKPYLEQLGLFNAERHIDDIISLGERLLLKLGTSESSSLMLKSPSYISESVSCPVPSSCHLIIDIGGTNTKFGFRSVDNKGSVSWQGVQEYPNPSLDVTKEGKSYDRFASELFRRIKEQYWPTGRVDGLALVWSNALDAYPLIPALHGAAGVGGTVTARKTGYKKGEFFIADLVDGDDLFKIFFPAAKNNGFIPTRVIIANDTIFTATSVPGATGGMIASTGANATVWESGCFGNPEMGVGIKLIPEWLTVEEKKTAPIRLEDLTCGRTLPSYFLLNASYLLSIGIDALKEPLRKIEDMGKTFSSKTLAEILKGTFEGTNDALCEVAAAHERRAAILSAVMAYLSVKNHLSIKGRVKLALDSTLARNFPAFLSQLQIKLDEISNGKVEVILVRPEGHISVPMIGAAAALDSLS